MRPNMRPNKHNRPAADLSGKIIGGAALQLLRPIGSGSFGTVYLGVEINSNPSSSDTRMPKLYAVKVLPMTGNDSRREMRQRREIHLQNRAAGHRNVAGLHFMYRDHEYLYILMSYCAGGDMQRAITHRSAFVGNDEHIKHLFLQVIDAVAFCHSVGVYHRDIKPANIFMNADYTKAYLGDFGLAVNQAWSNAYGAGSSYWMCPEVTNKAAYPECYSTQRGDIWGLGILLVNMITGKNIWRRAWLEDSSYYSYRRHGSAWLRTMLPLSQSACYVLERIFTRSPHDCISLPELREIVEQVDTFFMSPEDLAQSSRQVREVYHDCRPDHKMMFSLAERTFIAQREWYTVADDSRRGLSGALHHMVEDDSAAQSPAMYIAIESASNSGRHVHRERRNIPVRARLQPPGYTDVSSEDMYSEILVTPDAHALDAAGIMEPLNVSDFALPPLHEHMQPKKSRRRSAMSKLGALVRNLRARV